MWVIHFQARCERLRSDSSSLTAADAARRVEAALSVAMLELCGYVEVGAVSVAIGEDSEEVTEGDTAIGDERRAPLCSVPAAMANEREIH